MQFTVGIVAKFIAGNICILNMPVLMTHCTPHSTSANMKYAFPWLCVSIQSDISLSAIGQIDGYITKKIA